MNEDIRRKCEIIIKYTSITEKNSEIVEMFPEEFKSKSSITYIVMTYIKNSPEFRERYNEALIKRKSSKREEDSKLHTETIELILEKIAQGYSITKISELYPNIWKNNESLKNFILKYIKSDQKYYKKYLEAIEKGKKVNREKKQEENTEMVNKIISLRMEGYTHEKIAKMLGFKSEGQYRTFIEKYITSNPNYSGSWVVGRSGTGKRETVGEGSVGGAIGKGCDER